MFKWDGISWIAAGIFIAGIALGGLVNNGFLLLLVLAYLLRPILLAFGVEGKFADERQRFIQYHSGNIALIVVVLALCVFAVSESMQGRPADNYNLLICIALAARALTGLVMYGDYRVVAMRMGFFIGLLWFLFSAMEGGFSLGTLIEGGPGLILILAAWFGYRKPPVGAVVFALFALATIILFGVFRGFTLARIGVSLILCVPLAVTAFCFYKAGRSDDTAMRSTESAQA